ncbi:Fic/DOC family protein [Glutamicibacter sp.]|uniref:Fic/DOC family protein n=1 Tax=Glutamicibacter sp. TaxID=1931995 RepID=UPI003FA5CE2B
MGSNNSNPDPYLLSPDGVLKNLVGADSYPELARAEADLCHARITQLEDHQLVAPTRDSYEIKGLHKHLFQDVYEWAGEFRTIDMRRGEGQFFAPYAHIPRLLDNTLSELGRCNNLVDHSQNDFVTSLCRFYDELNHIHPFREGNGRMQRTFWSRVAFTAGWILDWRPIVGDELNESSRAAREDQNMIPLYTALSKCVRPIRP